MLASTDLMSAAEPAISGSTLYILVGILMLVFIIPLVLYFSEKNNGSTQKLAYMGGINTGKNDGFVDYMGEEKGLYISNYYFEKMLGIDKLMVPSQIISSAALIIIFCLLGGLVIGGLL